MTNREKLMEELNALSNDAFYMMLADNRLTRAMDDAQCDYCKAHVRRCPSQDCDDVPCPVSLSDWLNLPNAGAPILPA